MSVCKPFLHLTCFLLVFQAVSMERQDVLKRIRDESSALLIALSQKSKNKHTGSYA